MPNIRHTKNPINHRQRDYDVVIIPGGWGSKWHYSTLRRTLSSYGISSCVLLRHGTKVRGRIVIAHSVGAYEVWENIVTEKLILVAPTFSSNPMGFAEITRRLIGSRKQELAYQRAHHMLIKGAVLVIKSSLFIFRDPGLMLHQYQQLKDRGLLERIRMFSLKRPDIAIEIVGYKNDAWADQTLYELLRTIPNIKQTLNEGPHDEILYKQEKYATMIHERLIAA